MEPLNEFDLEGSLQHKLRDALRRVHISGSPSDQYTVIELEELAEELGLNRNGSLHNILDALSRRDALCELNAPLINNNLSEY